jgi:hypothetical protein
MVTRSRGAFLAGMVLMAGAGGLLAGCNKGSSASSKVTATVAAGGSSAAASATTSVAAASPTAAATTALVSPAAASSAPAVAVSAPAGSAAASAPAVSAAASVAAVASVAAPTAASGGGTINVCSLLSAAQASSLNGVPYGATTPAHVQSGFDTCTYTNTGKAADPVDIQDLMTQVVALSGCYADLKQNEGPGTSVSGVGDEAFGYGIGIVVKVGARCISVSGLTDAELHNNYGPDVAMAKIIISGLS